MATCLISFGANIGEASDTVQSAARMLQDRLAFGDELQLSRFYKTPPVGGPNGQSPFVNAVAAISTSYTPIEVWQIIRTIERELGRERVQRWEARKIDLDILLYDDVRIWTRQLKIPHPRMCMRRFILAPAMEVAADWQDPVSQMAIKQLAMRVSQEPGSLTLVAGSEVQPMQVLESVAQFSHAKVVPANELGSKAPMENGQRLVTWVDSGQFASKSELAAYLNQLPTRLTVFWESVDPGFAWEDQHQELAANLRLSESSDPMHRPISIVGPRYLLATNDLDWAVHELVAALDAMDCVIEPL